MATAATAAAGCGDQGGVHVLVNLPQAAALSPLQRSLSQLTLIAERDGEPAQTSTRPVPAKPTSSTLLSFGDIAVGSGVRVSLLGQSASGRMVGFGRATTPLRIAAGESVDVTIRLRRPFAYVSGGTLLAVLDTTVEPGEPFSAELDQVANPAAVTTTPDGAEIVVVAGGSLSLLSTATHARTTAPSVALMPGAGAVALTEDTAYVLVDPSLPGPPPAYTEDCSKPSKLVPLPLAAPHEARPAIVIAGAARDVVAAPDGGSLVVAQRCQNAVTRVAVSGASQIRVFSVPNPNDVAIAGDRVWAVGSSGGANGARLVLATANLDGSNPTRLDFPLSQEVARSNDLAEDGQTAEVRLDADRLDPFALSVLPDARHVALLVHGSYHADEVVRLVDIGGVSFEEIIIPRLDLETYDYMLFDATTGIAAQRLRTSCAIDWERDTAVLDDWSCAVLPAQETADPPFVARQAAVLYGGQ